MREQVGKRGAAGAGETGAGAGTGVGAAASPNVAAGVSLGAGADEAGTVAAAVPGPAAPELRTLHEPAPGHGTNRRRTLAVALACAAALLAVLVAGLLLREAATATDFTQKNLAPSLAHPFGTDWMGRDMLARTLAGLSTSLLVGLLAAVVSAGIALLLAAVSVVGGPAADAAVGWLCDLVLGLPTTVLVMLVSYALGKGAFGVTVAVAVTHWPSLMRLLRAEMASVLAEPFVAQSRALGVSSWRVLWRHVLPAILPQLLVGTVLLFPHAILHEASVTFLGFGLSAEEPAVGVILSEAMSYLSAGYWWLAVCPGAALLACVLLFERVGSCVRRLVAARTVQA